MPMYTWVNADGEEVTVIRAVEDIDVEPTEEETLLEGPWARAIVRSGATANPYRLGGKGRW